MSKHVGDCWLSIPIQSSSVQNDPMHLEWSTDWDFGSPSQKLPSLLRVLWSNIEVGAAGEDDAGNDHKSSKEKKNDDSHWKGRIEEC